MAANELRKMYTPPIRGVIFPSKNPFYNGKIVDYATQSDANTSLLDTYGQHPSTCSSSLIKPNHSSLKKQHRVLNTSSKNRKLERMIKARVNYLQYASGKIMGEPYNVKE